MVDRRLLKSEELDAKDVFMENVELRLDNHDQRLGKLEHMLTESTAVRGVWPEYVFINGYKIRCNRRSRTDGSSPVKRAIDCCKELEMYGLRPSYKALRACHFGSVTAKKALAQYGHKKFVNYPLPPGYNDNIPQPNSSIRSPIPLKRHDERDVCSHPDCLMCEGEVLPGPPQLTRT